MKVLWMSNVEYSAEKPTASGTWLHSMFDKINRDDRVDITCNITFGSVKEIERRDYFGMSQYIIPHKYATKNGLPKKIATTKIIDIIKEINPDIIHVWGLELYWGLIALAPELSNYKVLIEIQGIKSECAQKKYFYGGLSVREILSTYRLVEFVYPSAFMINCRKKFENWGKQELKMLQNCRYINTQSQWVRNIVTSINDDVQIFKTGIILRDEFIDAKPWYKIHKIDIESKNIFTITSNTPYKGVHVTIKAFALIKRQYPQARLRIAGIRLNSKYYKNNGYVKYLLAMIKELNLTESVTFLGNIDAETILTEMYNADLFVMSSYVETYCLALAEAMLVGVPCVSSYSCALAELIEDNTSGLYYPMGDHYTCANKIIRYLEDADLCARVSVNASKIMRKKSDSEEIIEQQIETYRFIIEDSVH